MAVVDRDFESWLHEKLTSLDIDSDVYGSYISGILADEDDEELMKESLEGILCSFVVSSLSQLMFLFIGERAYFFRSRHMVSSFSISDHSFILLSLYLFYPSCAF